jgi:3-oxoadipate enol-lactonase
MSMTTIHSRNLFVAVDDVKLHCRIDETVDATAETPWLVFSNSLMTDLSLWDAQVAAFAGRFRILRYDQRGHGASSVPAGDCTFERLADDLAALMDHVGIPTATVVGVSMGGVTTLALAARHPARVSRAMLCDCQSVATPAGAKAWDERIALADTGGMQALADVTVKRWFLPAAVAAAGPGIGVVRAMIAATPREGFVRAARALQSYDFCDALPALRCPALFAVGAGDGVLPDVMRALAERCADARFVALAAAGHLPNVEQPEAFNTALADFLTIPA